MNKFLVKNNIVVYLFLLMVLSILLRKKLRSNFSDSIILDVYMLGLIVYSYYIHEVLAYGLTAAYLFLKLKSVYKREGFEDSETDEDSEESNDNESDDNESNDNESNDNESNDNESDDNESDDNEESNDNESEETTTMSPSDDEETSDSSNEIKIELNRLVRNIEEDLGKLKEKVETIS